MWADKRALVVSYKNTVFLNFCVHLNTKIFIAVSLLNAMYLKNTWKGDDEDDDDDDDDDDEKQGDE